MTEDYGARIRAAQAYAGLEQGPFAEALGFSTRTLDRLFKNERDPTIPEVKKIAEVCRVPVGFLVEGWNVARPIQDRLTDIERSLEEVAKRQPTTTKAIQEAFEDYAERLGPRIGKRPPRSRRSPDPRAEEPPAAA